jgi:hypothetical protein
MDSFFICRRFAGCFFFRLSCFAAHPRLYAPPAPQAHFTITTRSLKTFSSARGRFAYATRACAYIADKSLQWPASGIA